MPSTLSPRVRPPTPSIRALDRHPDRFSVLDPVLGLRIHRPGPLFVPANRQPAVRSCFRSADRLLASSSLDCRFSGLLIHFQPDWLHRSRKPRRCVSGLRGASPGHLGRCGVVLPSALSSWADVGRGLSAMLRTASWTSWDQPIHFRCAIGRFRHPGIPFRDEKGGDSHIGGCPYPERGFRGPGQPYSDRNSNVMGGPRFRPNCKQIIGATVS